jgi:hypothetical protein
MPKGANKAQALIDVITKFISDPVQISFRENQDGPGYIMTLDMLGMRTDELEMPDISLESVENALDSWSPTPVETCQLCQRNFENKEEWIVCPMCFRTLQLLGLNVKGQRDAR